MPFVPRVNQPVWFDGRAEKAALVLGVDEQAHLMWIRPIDGGVPFVVQYTDRWSDIPPHPDFPELWCVVTPGAVSKGFPDRDAVLAGAPANSLALLHVNPDNTVTVEYPFL